MICKGKHDACKCHNENVDACKLIENYRSILDRQRKEFTSWKIINEHGRLIFQHGKFIRKENDALLIRLNHNCLINPWYEYVHLNKNILKPLEQNNCSKVFELILIECDCQTSVYQCAVAIMECPCFEQLNRFCTFCNYILRLTKESVCVEPIELLTNGLQQMNISFPTQAFYNNKLNMKNNLYQQLEPYHHQNTVQSQIQSVRMISIDEEYQFNRLKITKSLSLSNLEKLNQNINSYFKETKSTKSVSCPSQSSMSYMHRNENYSTESLQLNVLLCSQNTTINYCSINNNSITYRTQETQTKLFAILLPQSPLIEMEQAKIVEQTSSYITRVCQVNTLSYLIQINRNQNDSEQSIDVISRYNQLDVESETLLFHNDIISSHNSSTIPPSTSSSSSSKTIITEYQTSTIEKTKRNFSFKNQQVNNFMFVSSPLKCLKLFENIDFSPYTNCLSLSQPNNNNSLSFAQHNQDDRTSCQLTFEPIHECLQESKHANEKHSIKNNNTKIHDAREYSLSKFDNQRSKLFRYIINHYRYKKQNDNHHQCLKYRKAQRKSRSNLQRYHRSSCQTFTDKNHSTGNHLLYTLSDNLIQSNVNLHQNPPDTSYQYKIHDHIVVARISKNSIGCKELKSLLNDNDSPLEQFLHSQLIMTCYSNYKSVCIIIDDYKQSEVYRKRFLECIYTILSNTLKEILSDKSVELKSMNLRFLNNSLYDIVHLERLRLIDTGKNILLLPACEIKLKSLDDIDKVMQNLNTKMPFAHQLFIINFTFRDKSLSSSYLFLQLAPICSMRPIGLASNLNSTTYSVLNLIRQLCNGQLFHGDTVKRFLLNDCSLNRLLKSYLFSSQQMLTVLTTNSNKKCQRKIFE